MWRFSSESLEKYGFQKPEATMLFDTLKMSCEKLAEKDGQFKFLLQSFRREHSSVNGLVTMDTVRSLYDMILDHSRSFVSARVEVSKAVADKAKTSGCFHCGSKDHWQADCPKRDDQGYGKGQPAQAGVNVPQQAAKGKAKGQAKGQSKGQPGDKQAAGAPKGKGKSGRKGSGKKGGKGGKKRASITPDKRGCS